MQPEKYYVNIRIDTIADLRERPYLKILEIGGGNFSTLSKILDMYPEATGFGIDMVNMCEDSRIKVIVGSLNSADVFEKLGTSDFDLIIANDVLEHLLDPGMVLDQLFKHAASSAYIHVSVPNIRQMRAFFHLFLRGRFPKDDSGLFDRTHMQWFCRKDIVAMIEEPGFQIVDSYLKGRYIPSFAKRASVAEFLGLQSITIAQKPDA